MKPAQAEHYLEMMRYQDVDWRDVYISRIISFLNEQETRIRQLEDENEQLRAEVNYGCAKEESKSL